MGKIFKEIVVLGTNGTYKKLKALFDTGAYYNYISKEFRDKSSVYGLGIVEFREEMPIVFPNGFYIDGRMIKLKTLKIGDDVTVKEPQFCLFDMRFECDVIIGAKLMQELKMVLKPSIKEISFENSTETTQQYL